ncbi:MAG: cysteinyl-tRNA synthetase [Anaerolineae bacterium]|jgi:cyanophycinase-like exopeptidase|nr:cysteinyl-tRNA synthetase [Anaerolineae bacterium]MBT7190739.1 cysteinyl-tRNA synthetase [Anaerolineae bacterium]MBT7989727.1 cysteinyl-tRNA synthetase [Anaerolineae bacterium]
MFGKIAFLGSGETSLAGGRIFESLVKDLDHAPKIAIMETTAGFELNSPLVAQKVGDYLSKRLQNYVPQIHIIPARKRGTEFSPDNPAILAPLLSADLIFMGPGSPTYAVRQLKNSLAWDIIRARHRRGTALVFASAATIAISAHTLPVYEIFKVGEDIHFKEGLDLFKDFGLPLSFIPHWNNAEGGADLDTSRCFVGRERFDIWRAQLPPNQTIIGLDEHTGIILDFETQKCRISGVSSVTICDGKETKIYPAGEEFNLAELGTLKTPDADEGISNAAFEFLRNAPEPELDSLPPTEVQQLAESRQKARANKDFAKSDQLRDQINALGWDLRDTSNGQELVKKD